MPCKREEQTNKLKRDEKEVDPELISTVVRPKEKRNLFIYIY